MLKEVYLGTVLLEKNRWSTRVPTIRPSEWAGPLKAAGFDGFELWENHVLCQPGELEALQNCGLPVSVFNTYLVFDEEPFSRYEEVAAAITALGAKKVKFNLENQSDLTATREKVLKFLSLLPSDCKMLCECHPGTVLEDPATAAAFFETLPADRFGVILHANDDPALVAARYDALGRWVEHLHSRTTGPEDAQLKACIRLLQDKGFSGTATIEFVRTSFLGQEEDPVACMNYAIEDMHALKKLF